MFGGIGIWSGGGADAASSSLDKRIADLESVKEKLDASAELFSNAVTAVVNAKNQIISNVEIANKMLDWVRDHPDIPGDEKEAAIRAGVDAVRAENAAIVATAGSQISGKPAELPEAPRPDDVLLLHGNDPKQGPAFFHASNGGQSPGTTIPLDSPRALVHVGTVPPLPQSNPGKPADPTESEDSLPPLPEPAPPALPESNPGLPDTPPTR